MRFFDNILGGRLPGFQSWLKHNFSFASSLGFFSLLPNSCTSLLVGLYALITDFAVRQLLLPCQLPTNWNASEHRAAIQLWVFSLRGDFLSNFYQQCLPRTQCSRSQLSTHAKSLGFQISRSRDQLQLTWYSPHQMYLINWHRSLQQSGDIDTVCANQQINISKANAHSLWHERYHFGPQSYHRHVHDWRRL